MDIILTPERTFRRTPGVHFADISIPHSNGIDLVEHDGPSVSPPNKNGFKQWYVHNHQTDNNRVIKGSRLFELYCEDFNHPHWYVFLTPVLGALRIPPGCYHRSVSGKEGSTLLNHAVRDNFYDENTEFIPRFKFGAAIVKPHYYGITAEAARHFLEYGELRSNE